MPFFLKIKEQTATLKGECTMVIEIAKKDDIPALSNLLTQLFTQEASFHPDTELQEKGLRAIIDNPDIGHVFAAKNGDEVFGMVSLLYTISTANGGKVALLEDFIVDKNWRKRGIGHLLIEHCLEFAKQEGCSRVTLFTDCDNLNAQKIYREYGFDDFGMLPMRMQIT